MLLFYIAHVDFTESPLVEYMQDTLLLTFRDLLFQCKCSLQGTMFFPACCLPWLDGTQQKTDLGSMEHLHSVTASDVSLSLLLIKYTYGGDKREKRFMIHFKWSEVTTEAVSSSFRTNLPFHFCLISGLFISLALVSLSLHHSPVIISILLAVIYLASEYK